jgi:hypothetical protein
VAYQCRSVFSLPHGSQYFALTNTPPFPGTALLASLFPAKIMSPTPAQYFQQAFYTYSANLIFLLHHHEFY